MSLLYVGPEHTRTPAGWYSTPAGLTSDLDAILRGAAECATDTIVLDRSPIEGGPDALVAAMNAAGWEQISRTTDRGWFTLTKVGVVRANLAIREWCPGDEIMGPHLSTKVMLGRMLDWQARFVEPYRMTPGVSLLAMMYGMVGGSTKPRLQDPATAEWWQPPAQIGDLRYAGDWKGRVLHRWDMRSAYLAAAAQVELPRFQLGHTGPWGRGPGYYRIRITAGPTAGLGKPDRHGCLWVTHSMLDVLTSGRWKLDVIDSFTTDRGSGRILRRWSDRIRDTMANLPQSSSFVHQIPAPVIKHGYAAAIGLLNTPRGLMYRPDWRHMIIDAARASMVRRIASVARLMEGLQPARVDVDSVWYDTDDPEHVGRALGEGAQIGRMRYEGPGRLLPAGKATRWTPLDEAVSA